MAVHSTVLFDLPQTEIASRIRNKLQISRFVQIVSGFATVEGLSAIKDAIMMNPAAIDAFIVGAGTYRAYEALDSLVSAGVPNKNLFVHLGHTRITSSSAKYQFYRYHPMLHSKVYYMEHDNDLASAIIGSHNVTGFALMGLNGEAAVMLEGSKHENQFRIIRQHIQNARSQAVEYKPGMKEAYSWWTVQFMEGLRDKTNDTPKDSLSKKTIVIITSTEGKASPQKNDLIYFELPSALGKISSLQAEVHLYLFDTLPSTPWEGLQNLKKASYSYWCRTLGIEMEQGGVELKADWYIDNNFNPILKQTPKPFRPTPTSDMQQVRVQVYNKVYDSFEYLFGPSKKMWEPLLSEKDTPISATQGERELLSTLDLVPPEDAEWFLVKDLKEPEVKDTDHYALALMKSSPESGSYVMMSTRRRKLGKT